MQVLRDTTASAPTAPHVVSVADSQAAQLLAALPPGGYPTRLGILTRSVGRSSSSSRGALISGRHGRRQQQHAGPAARQR